MVLMTQSQEISTIRENIFENRFMHVSELRRMGANIEVVGNRTKNLWRKTVEWCRVNGYRSKGFC